MRIYNKKGFWSGIISIGIGILGLTTMIINGFSFFSVIGGAFLILVGITEISRSISRKATIEDKIESQDERNCYVELKAGKKAFQITKYINIIVVILLVIAFSITRYEDYAKLFIIPGLYVTINIILEYSTISYYEK